ncbi:Acyl transferase domain-containing protein [Roseateles sp. YR242]|uniref:type I polyketide synthase n=1 Tax=Roseateles sp. YR242 TaxID=1855305 RepID=UPI0008C319D4|nr:type I polyketide synthase [Roseateles sp. YR242]SEL61840.1 Acyl transferase domain-containing protein [Roseateles sp. YR242]
MPSSQDPQDLSGDAGLDIAIIGMSGRFPDAPDVETFWRNIRDGVESVRRYSDEELRQRGVPDEVLADPHYVKAGVPFDGVDLFDAEFFSYTPRDAQTLDPQHRIFLECAWAALEHAGYDPQRYPGSIGVYAGTGASVYLMRHLLGREQLAQGGQIADLLGLLSGNIADALCTRVAYKLDLRGPAVTVQTACSTSLTAVHSAVQSLLGHECDMALAGGVSLNLLQTAGYHYQPGAIFSPDGHCRAFDARAGGTVLGSGAGVVVLKRLEDALRDGDTVHAVIKGSAANNDGADKVAFTAPSVSGQAGAIRAAQAVAGVSPRSIAYVEAHGTGTTLGDPIEVEALNMAFRDGDGPDASAPAEPWCALGSVKTNIGHLDAAAGVTGLIKTALALQHQTLPPSLNFQQPNPGIDFAGSPFRVNVEARPWLRGEEPRRAGVSAFGIGGTNVHVVLEEAPAPRVVAPAADAWQVLPLSARHDAALSQQKQRLASHLQAHPALPLSDVAFTLQQGRQAFAWRSAVVADRSALAADMLAAPTVSAQVRRAPEVVFLFPGGGTQHAGMGTALYRHSAFFRQQLDHCLALLQRNEGLDLREVLFAPPEREAQANATLSQMSMAQPALFAVEYALAQWWLHLGVKPALMLGHSLGEYVAACVAGVFTLEDALRVVAERGRLMQTVEGGAMTAVPLDEQALQPFLADGCDLAAVNGEGLCVLAGPVEAIARAEAALSVHCLPRRLHVAMASHSSLVDPIVAALERTIASVPRQAPRLPFISNVTGRPISAEQACSPAYWGRHLRGTVRFADGLAQALAPEGRVLLEVGPGETLAGLARQHGQRARAVGIWSSQAHPQQHERNARQLAGTVAALWTVGVEIDWKAWQDGQPARRVPLPTYPFQRRRYWVEAQATAPSKGDVQIPSSGQGPTGGADAADGAVTAADSLYHARWERQPLDVATPGASPASGVALLLGDASTGLLQALAADLRQRGLRVMHGMAGKDFKHPDPDVFQLRPDQSDDHVALLHAVRAEAPVRQVFHLWGAGAQSGPGTGGDAYFSLLALIQALDRCGLAGADAPSLTVVADGIEDVAGVEPLAPEKATLLGLAKVAGQEYPQVKVRVIDVMQPSGHHLAEQRLAAAIAEEAALGDEWIVALRGPHRWVRRFEPLPATAFTRRAIATSDSDASHTADSGKTSESLALAPLSASASSSAPASIRLRQNGVYLITGGMGGVGLALSRYLARHWGARLALLARTPLPPRGRWEALAAAQDQPMALRRQLRQLIELEALGASVLTLEADVTQPQQLHAALEQIHAHHGPVHGVIHAVVHPGRGLISQRSRADIEAAFAPKREGSQHLLRAVAGEPLDFVLLCSSVASLIGGLNRSDYAAANAYMDALAVACRRDTRLPVISVNWDAWRDVGIAVDMDIPDGVGLDEASGVKAFERILAREGLAQVVVSTTAFAPRLAPLDQGALAALESQVPAAPVVSGQPRPVLPTAYVAADGLLQEGLAAIWSDMTGISPIGAHDSLFDLGGDSLLAIRLLSRVRKTYGVELHPADFFRAPTIAQQADEIERRLLDEIEQDGAAEAPHDSMSLAP